MFLFKRKLYKQMKIQIFTADIHTLEKIPEKEFEKIPIVRYDPRTMKQTIIGKCIKVEFGFASCIIYLNTSHLLDMYSDPLLVPIKKWNNVTTLAISEHDDVYDEIYTI